MVQWNRMGRANGLVHSFLLPPSSILAQFSISIPPENVTGGIEMVQWNRMDRANGLVHSFLLPPSSP